MKMSQDLRVVQAPHILTLSPGTSFDSLTFQEKVYAHHMARASWLGTRIILSQVSSESVYIFDFIMELYRCCNGDWNKLQVSLGVSHSDMRSFLDYAAVFLQNIGNYYGHGDQKFTPNISSYVLAKLSLASPLCGELYRQIALPMTSGTHITLGFDDEYSQTSYYTGVQMTAKEVEAVSNTAIAASVQLENTRILKQERPDGNHYDVLQASVEKGILSEATKIDDVGIVRIVRGDHSSELAKINESILLAQESTDSSTQKRYLANLRASLRSGDMEVYKQALRDWVLDLQPPVETTLGFVEPYRDPYGVRAEFEGLVGVMQKEKTELLSKLVEHADRFISCLPWIGLTDENKGNGPFELSEMGYRDFTCVSTLAYCSTLIFPGINLPNYNDIRQHHGSKNIMMSNAMNGGSMSGDSQAEYILPSDKQHFLAHRGQTYYLWVVFHELFGHGTGRFLEETAEGDFNFDLSHPPTNPTTGRPIHTWYRPGQTWTELFGDIATTVDECRAECIGAYLLSNVELLEMCGYSEGTATTPKDLEYNMYLQLGVCGLRSLENYSETSNKWGQAHSRAHFAMFRTLLENCDDFMSIEADPNTGDLTVHLDRSKIATHGRPAIGSLALKLHIFRCTADADGCRKFYEDLTVVGPQYLAWKKVVMSRKPPTRVFVQPNTSLKENDVLLKEYPASAAGMIQSWAERGI